MDGIAQDLASALEESELKKDIDDHGDVSAASPRLDRELQRKRRTRKRRTASTSSHLVSNFINNLVVKQNNTSPRSSSSWDEVVKDYVESLTANCSDESDEHMNSLLQTQLQNAVLSNNLQVRGHHKRIFKQATPCCCESDSYTENGSTLPVLRRHKKKKIKRMTIDSNSHGDGLPPGLTSMASDGVNTIKRKKKGPQRKDVCENNTDKMACKTTKLKRERNLISCLLCSQNSCDKSQTENSVQNGLSAIATPKDEIGSPHVADHPRPSCKVEDQQECQCRCHLNPKDESSISSTSGNSDTDSANFTQDDVGGDGDDEMTDFYAESENGPVWGVPNICGMRWWPHGPITRSTKEETIWLHKMEISDINCTNHYYDNKVKRFVSGSLHSDCSRRGFHARNNRLPGMAARSIRRSRRRVKMKKSKEKSSREQDLLEFQSSLSKLSLSARNKRIKLEDNFWRDAYNNRNVAEFPHRLFQSFPSSKGMDEAAAMEVKSHSTATQSHEDAATTSSFSEVKR